MSTTRPQRLSASSAARYGCYLGLLTALVMLGSALAMLGMGTDNPLPFKIAFLVAGVIQAMVSVFALRGKRAAWSFALSLNGTLAAVFLFGAPKVRDGLDVPIALGLLPMIAFALITTLLALGAEDY